MNSRSFYFVLALFLLWPALAGAAPGQAKGKGLLRGAHANTSVLPTTCRSCHRGMVMRVTGEEGVCLDCHGSYGDRARLERQGYLDNLGEVDLADIGEELRKPYSHPVLAIDGVHRRNEVLPEEIPDVARHSECVDCHAPHVVSGDRPFRGLGGKKIGNFFAEIDQEYELCYKCHSTSANLPVGSTDKAAEFRPTNPSFHPVEDEGKNTHVISLKDPYAAREELPGQVSTISCRDCHGSDEKDGPRGPHGSRNPGLLVLPYEMSDGLPESQEAYALCYDCHNRDSILGNESFPYHAAHIVGDAFAGRVGTSCFTCHDAHGSTQYQYLIRFNEEVVEANAEERLEYKALGVGARHGYCLLNCHGVEHADGENRKEY